MKVLSTLSLLLLVIPVAVVASKAEPPAATAEEQALCAEAITVFQDVSGMGRKDRAAKNMTKRHSEMAEDGWQFADMEVYTENGDLEGFYLSYTRKAPCPPDPE